MTNVIKLNTIVINMNTIGPASGQRHPPSRVLKTLLGSAARAKLLSHFVLHPGEAFHVRELERLLGEPASNLLRDLRRLKAIRLLESQRSGNQVRYTLDRKHPLHEDLQRLVLKTAAVGTVLFEALRTVRQIELAFVYGSFVKGEADSRSDIDLMVIGKASDLSLAPAIADAERTLGREVSYTRYTRAEARTKAQQRDSFVRSVLAGPKIVVVGKPNDQLFELAQR